MQISASKISAGRSSEVAGMMSELLDEIMCAIDVRAFNFVRNEAQARLEEWIADGKYQVFVASDETTATTAGFVAMIESYSVYAGGAFGTIPALYVRPAYRREKIGKALVEAAKQYGSERGWKRLEVTTPPLPQFQRTLAFYEREGFEVSGGRKLQIGL